MTFAKSAGVSVRSLSTMLGGALLGAAALALSGCNPGGSSPAPTSKSVTVRGQVLGGQQPVTGASVSVFAAGSGAAVTSTTTDGSGNWSITFTCAVADTSNYYFIARGGSSGGGSNTAIAMMSAPGACAGWPSSLNINELTTMASVANLASFMDATGTQLTGSSVAIATAMGKIPMMANLALGTAQATYGSAALLNTLADLLASCVNDTSGGHAACAKLFTDAKPPAGAAPTDTLEAALDLTLNPTNNTSALNSDVPPNGPFQPTIALGSSVALAAPTPVSGGSASGLWLAYQAVAQNGAGQTGLFVIPSTGIGAAPSFVNNVRVSAVGAGISVTISSGTFTGSGLGVLLYWHLGADGNNHLYGLDLRNTTAVPTEHQVSSLSFPAASTLCDVGSAQATLTDPTSLFYVFKVSPGDATTCGSATTVQVIHYTDGFSTAPVTVSLDPASDFGIETVYQSSGALGVLLALDTTTQQIKAYASSAFTAPAVAISNVSTASVANSSPGSAYLAVTTTSSVSPTQLWRVGANGTSALEYTSANQLGTDYTTDANNLYFIDVQTVNQSPVDSLRKIPLGGGASTEITSVSPTLGPSFVGSTGTKLIFQETAASGAQSILTAPVSVGAPTTIFGPLASASGSLSVHFGNQSIGSAQNAATALLYLNITLSTFNPNTFAVTVSKSSEVIDNAGAVKLALTPNSEFVFGAAPGAPGMWLSGITSTDGSQGGATVNSVDSATLAATPFGNILGGSFAVPAGASVFAFSGFGTSVGSGELFSTAAGVPQQGFAYDSTAVKLRALSIANTDVSPVL